MPEPRVVPSAEMASTSLTHGSAGRSASTIVQVAIAPELSMRIRKLQWSIDAELAKTRG